ncbi:hydroxyethylthiazole kinase [Zhihengliuella halotolerans]|uniref:Hydroxyethylthiazole kinase n=2 Tax=Zhihengliuella halotolerans TaxID=370736 RepID=A0A4Q8AH57_9MICC|nr:hydroxyethylthiazole kinase [Zhihengliuella halotolerans]
MVPMSPTLSDPVPAGDGFTRRATALTAAVRATSPLIQCATNQVVANFTANVLLAAGPAPAMVDVPGEAGEFAAIASALLVNLGTPHEAQRVGMLEAVGAATVHGTPWVLDPVAAGAVGLRTRFAHELLTHSPAVVRGNASEILALAGTGSGGRGVDATDDVDAAVPGAVRLALTATRHDGAAPTRVVAVSGAADLITDGRDVIRVGGGSELLTRVTGGGCALGAIIAAFVATGRVERMTDVESVAAAHAFYSAAAERAAAGTPGPGSFQAAFLDALATVTPADIGAFVGGHARVARVQDAAEPIGQNPRGADAGDTR